MSRRPTGDAQLTVVLVAEESAGLRVLRRLTAGGHRVAAVLTTPTRRSGAGVASAAHQLALPVMPAESVRDPSLARLIVEWEADLLLNVHSLHVVHDEVVRAPRIGSFNLHPGPLPEYAGLNTPSWAIANGESRHGATVHWMEAGIDTGSIAYEASFEITGDDTGLSLGLRCIEHGVELVGRLLDDAAAGTIPSRKQDLSRRRYYGRAAPDGGRLRWDRPARRVADLVRAGDYGPFPSPWGRPACRLDEREIVILNVARTDSATLSPPGTVGAVDADGALVAATDEWVLVRRVSEPGGQPVSPATLLREGERFDAGGDVEDAPNGTPDIGLAH